MHQPQSEDLHNSAIDLILNKIHFYIIGFINEINYIFIKQLLYLLFIQYIIHMRNIMTNHTNNIQFHIYITQTRQKETYIKLKLS